MKAFAHIDMLEISLILYEFLGETKPIVSKKLILFRLFNTYAFIFVLIYIFLNFFYTQEKYYAITLQSFCSVLQSALKYILLTRQAPAIQYVLNNILTKFWNYRCFDKNIRSSTEKIYKTVRYFESTIVVTAIFGLSFYLMKTIIISRPALPLESYIPESDIMLAILTSSQFYCLWLSLASVLAYDFVYAACCVHIILQLRLLKWKIKYALNKHKENTKQRICCYVKHHEFLYSMFHHMRNIFSVMLLFHYLVTLITTCFVLLQLFLRNVDAVSYPLQIIAIFFFIVQFGLYTFPAEEVSGEFLDISNAIYTSKWYKNDVEVQKLILFVMMKSQQQKYFTGAGLIDINVETFDSVLRKSLSFCAIFKNLLKN